MPTVDLSLWWLGGLTVTGVATAFWCFELGRSVVAYRCSRQNDSESMVSVPVGRQGDRDHTVRVPMLIRGVWPFTAALASALGPVMSVRLRAYLQRQLRRAGLDDDSSPQQIIASSLVWGLLGGSVTLFDAVSSGWGALLAALGALMPWFSLRDREKRQSLQIARELPGYVEMLTLALEAGGALSVALRVATDRARDGVLRRAFLRVQGDMRAGRTRAEALRALAERLEEPAVTTLVAALIQAETSGASLASVLRTQTEQRLNERFTRAEKQALEAPVKMLGPLVLCIFPCTFLMLALPVVVRFL